MPTDKKRVNLSIPEDVYERLQAYKKKYGMPSDAGACIQLIIRQLDAIEQGEQMMQMVSKFSMEELQAVASLGVSEMKKLTEKSK